MSIPKIHEEEYRFCLILWEHEPISAADLARLCADELGWKRTTTYTVIKRLGERGVLVNEKGTVTSLVPKRKKADFSLTLQDFSGLLCPKAMLSGALTSTVST